MCRAPSWRAQISTADLATAGTVEVTVFNSEPGGGISNAQTFAIDNPLPTLTGLEPSSAAAGGANIIMTVTGANFIDGVSTVRWNGVDRSTVFVSSAELWVMVSAADLATAGTVAVTVFNSAPGGGISNALTFTILPGIPVTGDRVIYLPVIGR